MSKSNLGKEQSGNRAVSLEPNGKFTQLKWANAGTNAQNDASNPPWESAMVRCLASLPAASATIWLRSATPAPAAIKRGDKGVPMLRSLTIVLAISLATAAAIAQ